MQKVIVICGPTASGKTALSIELAKKIDGEIVSCDSMQIYKDMNIGTAKPTKKEMGGIKHYLLDYVSPTQRYSVADYKADAKKAIKEILDKGKVPIVVGGTGLYVDSLIYEIEYILYAMLLSTITAAIAPSAAAVTTCLRLFTRTSPAAYTPGIFVCMSASVGIYPLSSISTLPLKMSELGIVPMNPNTPNIPSSSSASILVTSPVFTFLTVIQERIPSPPTSSTTVSHIK